MPIPESSVMVEGHAIVSVDGMIAAADGSMPPALRSEADWRIFQAALDVAALVVLGRLGHTRHPNPGRRRLVLTRSVTDLEADPADPLTILWNPAGMEIGTVLGRLGIVDGVVAVTGGTGTFDLFVPYYDRFVLSEVRGLSIESGIPCFSKGHPRFVLPGAGLVAQDMELIDRGVVQTQWVRS
ncbi:MAG: dihydrofolate reductase [Devosia sp.]|uniref:dihydrofolate reductase n=1 Tax=Devosia sp. TaxID=1871048 RepID=UPI00260E5B8A|nr:dihydrofolate reductase [Devosia sp.]MDB5539192.1 dihydrofolate reductase [Devosia sp.]